MKNILIICSLLIILNACKSSQIKMSQNTDVTYAIRLKPGADLRKSLEEFVKEKKIQAGWIATCVGSLTQYNIRFANEQNGSKKNGHFEIVSLVGTLATNGNHIHISVSDSTGTTTGGHLLEGCIVYTTAEIVLHNSNTFIFKREKDGSTPWEELQIIQKQ